MKLSFVIVAIIFVAPNTNAMDEGRGSSIRRHDDRDGGKESRMRAMEKAPWENLEDDLGSSTRLINTSNGIYAGQCYPEFRDHPPGGYFTPSGSYANYRTNWNLVFQPDGICMASLYCAFENCNPIHGKDKKLIDMLQGWSEDNDTNEKYLDSNNPAFNLPSKVVFPQTAADVVTTIKFALENSVELSVKNSGHSYAGASTKANTLLVNMKEFPEYAMDSVVSCDETEEITGDLENQPCQLALARNKPGYIRAGGGESWSEVYLAVHQANLDQTYGFKYHVVGGAAGSVSPMGWTWQGGYSGTAGGRLYGYGVDQVLMVEVVLPNGKHVRFGPIEWEDALGFDVPRTTKVEGVCNTKSSESDEALWDWQECDEDINFDDLWFAFNGSGFGTYGIVTSVYIQLHDYLPYTRILWGISNLESCGIEVDDETRRLFFKFSLNFLLDPSYLNGVDDDVSNGCGIPSLGSIGYLECYSEENVGDILYSAWEDYIESDFPEISNKDLIKACPRSLDEPTGTWDDYASTILIPDGLPGAGRARDDPSPEVCPNRQLVVNTLLPMEWVKQNKDYVVSLLVDGAPSYWAFGDKTGTSHDQANSLSEAHRNAGLMVFCRNSLEEGYLAHNLFVDAYDINGTGDDFPAFLGSNHVGPFTRGPLKDDWTQPCPLDFTLKEIEEKCISLQEAVWGSKTLRRLEEIKEVIDPNYMFDCTTCVGNNREKRSKNQISGDKKFQLSIN